MPGDMNWSVFINSILDGAFALDIKKTGSVSMFIQNRLSASDQPHTDTGYFEQSLKERVEMTPFSAGDALTHPDVYNVLIGLGSSFLAEWQTFAMKCCSLFVQLSEFHRPLNAQSGKDRDALLMQCGRYIVRLIEIWKTKYEVIGMKDIFHSFGFLRSVVEIWKVQVIADEPLKNPNTLLGIIYLGEWAALTPAQREHFFRVNRNKTLFGAIISDMERVEGRRIYNYDVFTKDCHHYFKEFYRVIEKRCAKWLLTLPLESSGKEDDTIRRKREFERMAMELYEGQGLNGEELKKYIEKVN